MYRIIKHALFFVSVLAAFSASAQQVGDTIEVRTLNYNSTTRDTVVTFLNNPSLSFEKIIMLYSMRCKDGQVSTGTARNKGCGEWDYSCNTYIADSAHIDSAIYFTPNYTISGFSGNFYNYAAGPTHSYYQNIQQAVVVNSTIADTASVIGTGTKNLSNVLQTALKAGKSQFLFTQSELAAAGVQAGNLDALSLYVASVPELAKFFRVCIKATSATTLSNSSPELTGFTEVYSFNYNFVLGANRVQFHTPFAWNGTSNIIVEFTFNNKNAASAMVFTGDSLATINSITTAGEEHFEFDGSNYIESDNFKGILGDSARTVEAWIRTTVTGKEIVSWGTNVTGQKYLVRLDGSGRLRMEVNGGNAIGTTNVADGEWHHIAVVQNGTSTTNAVLYVDGVAETISAALALPINTVAGINVRISKGIHNLYWEGDIAEVRIWSSALSQSTIQGWMHRPVTSAHANYSNLEVNYQLNSNTGGIAMDASTNARNATVNYAQLWSPLTGLNHFKGWANSNYRPKTTFYQGVYNLTVTTDTVLDTVQNHSNIISAFQIFPKYGTNQDDSIGMISQIQHWEATPEKVYNPNGVIVSNILVPTVGNITITDLPYFRRFPTKFEIMSFVTPYGINLNMGIGGKTWAFDVTDFGPILKGNQRLTVERGGQWQEDLDIRFLYIVGTPARDVLDIQQIWPVDKKSFASISANTSFEPRDVMMNPAGSYFKIRTMVTGHGQEGEFIPRDHFINLNGGVKEFNWQAWKECGYNPVYPQGGTWIYDRAGWCPGMATDLKEWDITNLVTAGQVTEIDYGINSATGTSDYIVNNQLVTYGAANFSLDASAIDIVSPSSKIEYERMGSLCQGPVVRIQNTGSTILTSLTINYWVNNAATPETYSWTGYLGFMETEDVILPVANVWDNLNPTSNVFHVEVLAPNGGADGYSYNNKVHSPFEIPPVLSNDFYVWFKTNNAGYESSYELLDDAGNVVINRSGMSNNTHYRDTVSLPNGCYTLKVYDTGHDGIDFWANSDGSGFLQFRSSINNAFVAQFEPDFGAEINYTFTVNYPLSFEDLNPITKTVVYPNPASDRVTLEMANVKDATVQFYSSTGQLLNLNSVLHDGKMTFNTASLSPGVYYLNITQNGNVEVHKVVIL